MTHTNILTCSGLCASCNTDHELATGGLAQIRAKELMHELATKGVLDIFSSTPTLSTESLFSDARGKMFGVLECEDNGNTTFLYAFSGQFCNLWNIEGWAPPLFDTDSWHKTNIFNEMRIKKLTTHIQHCIQFNKQSHIIAALKKRRKELSRNLMRQIHELYTIHSFYEKKEKLAGAFLFPQKIPTGAGDCCAPKLLNMAHYHGLKPVSIAEFFFGHTNKSGTKHHGQFYSSCTAKCAPLLGYMLCPLH